MAKKKSKKAAKEEFSLDPVREQLGKGEQLAAWVEAAFQHRAEFPPQVVLTVVGDYLVQWETLGPDLSAAAEEVSNHRSEVVEKAEGLRGKAKEVEALIDELNLRHVIGELSKDEFDERKAEAQNKAAGGDLAALEASLEEIDTILASVKGIEDRLGEAVRMHGALAAGEEPEPPAPEPEPAAEEAAPAPSPVPAPAAAEQSAPPPAAEPEQEWDVPPAMGAPESVPELPPQQEEAPAPTWAALDPGDAAGASGTGEDLMATGVITARPELVGADAPPVQPAADLKVDDKGEGPRLAVFSPDGKQQTYSFGGEVMSMGRGRNNDIQIKNDGKISRYHCRIFRRGDEFIIEDNKSSNGTLVDSKLVTRQRLDGGEQIQIGETRVIFQL